MKNKQFFQICTQLFFLFLFIFMTIKFVVIFFLRGGYEPQVLFDLTPFVLLKGLNYIQLLFLSYVVVVWNSLLHFRLTRRNLLISFIPSSMMLCGLGYVIVTKSPDISYIFHYVLFAFLLFVVVLDNKVSLVVPFDILVGPLSLFPKTKKHAVSSSQQSTTKSTTLQGVQAVSAQKNRELLNRLKMGLQQVEQQKKALDAKQQVIAERERIFLDHVSAVSYEQECMKAKEEETKQRMKQEIEVRQQSLEIFDQMPTGGMIIHRGVIKKINTPFSMITGYSLDEIVDTRLLHIISPEGIPAVKRHYMDRLKGNPSDVFETMVRTKKNVKLWVHVETTPFVFEGKNTEILMIKESENI